MACGLHPRVCPMDGNRVPSRAVGSTQRVWQYNEELGVSVCSDQITCRISSPLPSTTTHTHTHTHPQAAVTMGARVVLPKGDLFLGWPDSRGIADSYDSIPNVTEYDMFISAHSRYAHSLVHRPLHRLALRAPAFGVETVFCIGIEHRRGSEI